MCYNSFEVIGLKKEFSPKAGLVIALFGLGIALFGFARGEGYIIFEQAVRVCLECIGIG